jgi:hypothetical protein
MAATEVVELVGGVLSALGTPAAVWLAVRTWRREADRSRGEEALRRRQQPSRVVVRTEPALWPRIDGEGDYATRVATVVNASDEPVFDVKLFWHEGENVTDYAVSRVALLPGELWQQPMPYRWRTAKTATGSSRASGSSMSMSEVGGAGREDGLSGSATT